MLFGGTFVFIYLFICYNSQRFLIVVNVQKKNNDSKNK